MKLTVSSLYLQLTKEKKNMFKDSDAIVVRLALESEGWTIQRFWQQIIDGMLGANINLDHKTTRLFDI